MSDTIEYRPLPISTDDLLRLKAAVGDRDRDRDLRLDFLQTDVGEAHIAVMAKASRSPSSPFVTRKPKPGSRAGWCRVRATGHYI
jgi:hypothetical protein